jgi:hypothetical protein
MQKGQGTGGTAQVVEHLLCKHETLSSTKKKKRKKKRTGMSIQEDSLVALHGFH